MSERYQILGGPGSPYSHKLRAVFRYRRIPHTWKVPQGGFTGGGRLGSDDGESELAKAGKRTIPVVRYPDGSWWSDTTPVILDLEARHQGRSVLPPHPGVAFLAHLVEDMADEFLPLPMFHFRWTDDRVWCSRRQMIGWMGAISDRDLETRAQAFLERQAAQLAGAGGMQREQMERAWSRFMSVMEELLRHDLFLFGTRPSLAEFGIYGQLTQYVADPTVSSMLRERAVRTWQWTHLVDDLSGIEGAWCEARAAVNPRIVELLRYCAEFYVPMNELILSLGEQQGKEWDLASAANGMAYRMKCFLGLKAELAALGDEERDLIRPALEESGCWQPLQLRAGEAERVVPILPI